jgi:hypothetical protein
VKLRGVALLFNAVALAIPSTAAAEDPPYSAHRGDD